MTDYLWCLRKTRDYVSLSMTFLLNLLQRRGFLQPVLFSASHEFSVAVLFLGSQQDSGDLILSLCTEKPHIKTYSTIYLKPCPEEDVGVLT